MIQAQAGDAVRRGEAALAKGDRTGARLWFARARRLVPKDTAVAFALANVLLVQDDAEAVVLFTDVAEACDTREAWLGLSAACWKAGDVPGAAQALARVLSTHALPNPAAPMAGLANAVCVASGAPGWCGVTPTGPERTPHLFVACSVDVQVRVDGRPVSGTELPPGDVVEVTCGDTPLLGSPIHMAMLRRAEGFVEAVAGGLAGWIWLPRDVDAEPVVTVRSESGQTLTIVADGIDMQAPRPLARTRAFSIPAQRLVGMDGLLAVLGSDGSPLTGSPVDPGGPWRAAAHVARLAACAEPADGPSCRSGAPDDLSAPADMQGPAATAPAVPDRPVAIVIPIYRGHTTTIACLRSVFATIPAGTPVIVVDDATPEPALAAELETMAGAGRITLLRLPANQGFPASANAGLRAAMALVPAHDALLLNSDTLVPDHRGPTWLARLRMAVHGAPDIGTAAPLSNDATILSYPLRDGPNTLPKAGALARSDRQAIRANAGITVDIPTSVGFCMYVRRECLLETGLFRPALFAQGYGEENDFCIRARHLGWRHVAVPGILVAHVGGASFGAARTALGGRNMAVLERLHPGYRALIAAYQTAVPAADALAGPRRRLDSVRWADARPPASARQAVILVTHDSGGGVDKVVRGRVAALAEQGIRAILLRPVPDPDSSGDFAPGLCRVDDGSSLYPNLVYHLPDELSALARLLRPDRPAVLEVHHRLGHHASVIALAELLALAIELRLHDYASFCPRISLVGQERRYCGEPAEVAVCEACAEDGEIDIDDGLTVAGLRARSAAEFARARRVIVPSADMASRMRRHFPSLQPEVVPLEDDSGLAVPPPPHRLPRLVCVIGAIGVEKGFDVLLSCARDAALRQLPLQFCLVGHSTDDDRLMQTGRVFVTGRYDEAEAVALIRAQGTHLAFLPSICPETWSFALGLAWRAGLRAAVFDIGAMAARVRETGLGWIMPLGLPPNAINNLLVASAGGSSLAGVQQDRLWKHK